MLLTQGNPGCFCLRPFPWCFSLVPDTVVSVSNALEKPRFGVFVLILNLCIRYISSCHFGSTVWVSPNKAHPGQSWTFLICVAFPTSCLIYSPLVSLISVPQSRFCLLLFWSPKLKVLNFAKISFCPSLLIYYVNSYQYFFIWNAF